METALLELFVVLDTVIFSHTKKIQETGHGYLCVVSKRKGRPEDDNGENDVLTDDELVIARNF